MQRSVTNDHQFYRLEGPASRPFIPRSWRESSGSWPTANTSWARRSRNWRPLAAYVGVKHAISCSSGTDALLMPLMAYGVGPGDAIFTTPFTFIATAEVIQLLGATPVFVDIDPKTFNIDPEALAEAIANLGQNPKTAHLKPKGIIPVDLFGQPADYDQINALAQQHGLFVLEDAAQSFGATYKGQRAGSLAEVAATSFFPGQAPGVLRRRRGHLHR